MSEAAICPYLNEPCIGHRCMLFTHFTMKDPQTGRDRDEWTCAHALNPVMMLELANQIRQVAASVDSMRNEVVKRQDVLNTAAILNMNTRKTIPIKDVTHEQIEG